jgi:hypothetical protein
LSWCQILLSRILTFDYVSWLQHFKNVQLFKTFIPIVYLRNQNVKAIDNNWLFYYGRDVVADAPWSYLKLFPFRISISNFPVRTTLLLYMLRWGDNTLHSDIISYNIQYFTMTARIRILNIVIANLETSNLKGIRT